MLNFSIPPEVLAPFVPRGTVLDAFEGITYVSMVGFLFLDTRVRGLAIPWHRDFEEVNLRFYVRREAEEGWRRGVVFVKEIVPRWAIAKVARWVYNEHYVALPMRHKVERAATVHSAEYAWRFGGRWCRLAVRAEGEGRLVEAGSLDEFITEHYWGYAVQRDGGALEYKVEHPKWRVWRAKEAVFECDVAGLYGAGFAEALMTQPASAFLAEGSAVTVYGGRRIRDLRKG